MNHRRAGVRAAVAQRQRSQDHLRAATATVGAVGVVTAGAVALILPGSTHAAASATAPAGAVPGANSFTESQARSRLEKNGYSQVSGLTKGDDGIWRGAATKNGSSVHVTVDYKGNISVN